jgi:hypothetical protein
MAVSSEIDRQGVKLTLSLIAEIKDKWHSNTNPHLKK